ncbi:MAG: hypothetical protein KTR14_05225 [Vampirovibrio sp.]|nr:hypothetical protein [Vampirovibrio sp.]
MYKRLRQYTPDPNRDPISDKAFLLSDQLISTLMMSEIIPLIWVSFRFQATALSLTDTGASGMDPDLKDKEITHNIYDRLLFELSCFAGFLISTEEVEHYLIQKQLLLFQRADMDKVLHFNDKFLYALYLDLKEQVIGATEVVKIENEDTTIGIGSISCPLNAPSRLASYSKADHSMEVFEMFTDYLALAVMEGLADNRHYVHGKLVAAKILPTIRDIAKVVTRGGFQEKSLRHTVGMVQKLLDRPQLQRALNTIPT